MAWAARSRDRLQGVLERQRTARMRTDDRDAQRLRDLAGDIQDQAHLEAILAAVPPAHRAASLALIRPFLRFTLEDG